MGMAVAAPLPGGWVLVRLEPWDDGAPETVQVWLARQFERLRDHSQGGLLRRVAARGRRR
jgi:hypothetical protein